MPRVLCLTSISEGVTELTPRERTRWGRLFSPPPFLRVNRRKDPDLDYLDDLDDLDYMDDLEY